MVRGKQSGAKAPPRLDPTEWAPFDEALAQIKASVGSAELGVRDLHRDLRNGDLVGASRRIDYETNEDTCEIHEKTFWDQLDVWATSQGHVRVDPLRGWVFYVRRRELDTRYPRTIPETAHRKEPRAYAAIRQFAAKKWPDGYEHVENRDLVKKVGDATGAKRDQILRALGRRRG